MKLKYKIILAVVILSKYLCINSVLASTLSAISVTNNVNQAKVILNCTAAPVYIVFSLHNPERIVIDLFKTPKIHKNIFPINFNGFNLVKCIRTNTSTNYQNIRIVLDLICPSNIGTITQEKIGKNYHVILTILKKKTINISHSNIRRINPVVVHNKANFEIKKFKNNQKRIVDVQFCAKRNQEQILSPIIVAIDAGHGGQDPGATGSNGAYEKNITINIAKKLQILLNLDPRFKAVMIRDGDYFLSVIERSNIARKKKANILISIHADSAVNPNVKGASVWVLSNRRAKSETIHLLQCSEKYSELLGGLGDILTSYRNEPYIKHLVLDLQFCYSQRVGYDIASYVLHQLKNITVLHKKIPECSSLGILRSPDIPSILVETGFISNIKEERLLSSNGYQGKVANALYKGLCDYFMSLQKKQLDNAQIKKKYITSS